MDDCRWYCSFSIGNNIVYLWDFLLYKKAKNFLGRVDSVGLRCCVSCDQCRSFKSIEFHAGDFPRFFVVLVTLENTVIFLHNEKQIA